MKPLLKCECGATARNTSKERGRFKRRHPAKCKERHEKQAYTKELGRTYKSVLADKPEEE